MNSVWSECPSSCCAAFMTYAALLPHAAAQVCPMSKGLSHPAEGVGVRRSLVSCTPIMWEG